MEEKEPDLGREVKLELKNVQVMHELNDMKFGLIVTCGVMMRSLAM